MKNSNMGVHWKIQYFWGGGGVIKKNVLGVNVPEKGGGLGQFADLKGEFADESEWYIWAGLRNLLNDTMAHRHKISKANNTVLHCTNTVILLIIVIIILKLWGEKAIAGIAIFLSCGEW